MLNFVQSAMSADCVFYIYMYVYKIYIYKRYIYKSCLYCFHYFLHFFISRPVYCFCISSLFSHPVQYTSTCGSQTPPPLFWLQALRLLPSSVWFFWCSAIMEGGVQWAWLEDCCSQRAETFALFGQNFLSMVKVIFSCPISLFKTIRVTDTKPTKTSWSYFTIKSRGKKLSYFSYFITILRP